MTENLILSPNHNDNLSIASINTIISFTSQRIFEGLVVEKVVENESKLNCCGQSIAYFRRKSAFSSQKNLTQACAFWNSQNYFIHVAATPQPFCIYFDDIIATKKVGSDRFQLIAYILRDNQRQKIVYEICFQDFKNFEPMFLLALRPKLPPNIPKFTDELANSIVNCFTNDAFDVPQTFYQQRPKALVIINPFSGKKKALEFWAEHTLPIFEEAEIPFQLITTTQRGHATHLARHVNLDEFGAVVIVSGDGMVAEVIHGLLTRKDKERALCLPILHIPGGTGNGLAASVAFQCNEPFAARGVFCKEMALMLAGGRPRYRPLRLYHVETEKNGHLPMFMTITWGLVADIDLGSERFRWAGMIRLHIEAFIRIAQLPSVSRYRARISYLPVTNQTLLFKTKLTTVDNRQKFGSSHFDCEDVSPFSNWSSESTLPNKTNWEDDVKEIEEFDFSLAALEAFKGTHLTKASLLSEPVPDNWQTIEGEFVFVCLSAMSHLGSDLPYMPCSKLEEEVFYLTFVDWRTLKSRFHMAQLLLTMDRSAHLAHQCLQTIPVLACRVEPAQNAGGYVALDGEHCKPGQSFQVVSTSLQATIVARQPRIDKETLNV